MLFGLTISRAFAILLITNSHLSQYYPRPGVAAGGMIGNCIFFIVSGWALAHTVQGDKRRFLPWISRRLLRVYLPLFLVTTILLLIGNVRFESAFDLLREYLWPTEFWFVPAIAAFYVPVYLVARYLGLWWQMWMCAVFVLLLYFANYLIAVDLTVWSVEKTVQSKIFFYLGAMLLGTCAASMELKSKSSATLLYALIAGAAYVVAQKLLKAPEFLEYQFMAQLLGLAFSFALVLVFSISSFSGMLEKRLALLINYLSSRSLCIYLVQVPMLQMSALRRKFDFPCDLVLFLAITLLLAEFLYRVDPFAKVRKLGHAS